MSKRSATALVNKPDPRAIASAAVEEFFQEMIESREATLDGGRTVTLDNAFSEVQEAVKAVYLQENSHVDDGEAIVDEICAQEAGYLLGVQVGLRLRSVGGAR